MLLTSGLLWGHIWGKVLEEEVDAPNMEEKVMKLVEADIISAKPGLKHIKMFDGKGLYLLVTPSGSKYWRVKYRFCGKEKLLSLGSYPKVSLPVARLLCNEARQLLSEGLDPSDYRKKQKARRKAESSALIGVPSVRVTMGGNVEIWKGAEVLILKSDEAQFVKDILIKITM